MISEEQWEPCGICYCGGELLSMGNRIVCTGCDGNPDYEQIVTKLEPHRIFRRILGDIIDAQHISAIK